MDGMFIGADMLRTRDFKNWHVHDAAVTKEYTDLGGDADEPRVETKISR